jgi:hypothetical protein
MQEFSVYILSIQTPRYENSIEFIFEYHKKLELIN